MNATTISIISKVFFYKLVLLLFVTAYASKNLLGCSRFIASRSSRTVLKVVSKNAAEESSKKNISLRLPLCRKEPSKVPPPPLVSITTPKIVLPKPQKTSSDKGSKSSELRLPPPPVLVAPPLPPRIPTNVVLSKIPPAPLIPNLHLNKFSRTNQKTEKPKLIPPIKTAPPLVLQPKLAVKPVDFSSKNLPLHFGSKVDFDKLFSEYVVIDTEATGLGDGHEITELAAVKMRNMQPTGEKFHVYLNPGREVSSSAHKLTKHTWKELKRFPRFRDIAHKFLIFISDLPLVFHNAHFDLKLLNNNLKDMVAYKLEDRHVIVDTYMFAKSINPHGRNGLTHLATRYNLKRPGSDDIHGALIDADLLCEVFRGLYRENGSRPPKEPKWEKLAPLSVNSFQAIKNTPGESFFRELGIRCELPDTFRYMYNLYNPRLHRNFPAILIPFSSSSQANAGIYIRYIINQPLTKSLTTQGIDLTSRAFYGDITSFPFLHLHGDKDAKTLVLGSLSACLLFRDQLKSADTINEHILKALGANIAIQAYLDPCFLEILETSKAVDTIVILSEHDPLGKEAHKKAYFELINRLCLPQFLPFSKYKDEHPLFSGWLIRAQGENWTVSSQDHSPEKTVLHLTSIKYSDQTMQVVINDTEIHMPNEPSIPLSGSSLLLSPPRKKLVLIPLRCKSDGYAPLTSLAKKHSNHVYDRTKARLSVSQPKDLAFYDKIFLAQKLYEDALAITDDTPAAKYFQKRGINSKLPESFKYMPLMFHPGQDGSFPLTLVPLMDIDGRIVGIHRLFCDENGDQLLKKSGYPSKLSLGKAAGASIEVYKYPPQTKSPDTLLISEGIENALVVREAILNTVTTKKQNEINDLLNLLASASGLTIHAVVGVNGLIDAPIDSDIKTIILLADNDGNNKDVKSTLIKTVEHYLSLGKKVKIALPCSSQQNKVDLNDIYLSRSLSERDNAILEIIRKSIDITTTDQLGTEEEPIEVSLKKLLPSSPPSKKETNFGNISALEQQLMDLISERIFIEGDYKKPHHKFQRR